MEFDQIDFNQVYTQPVIKDTIFAMLDVETLGTEGRFIVTSIAIVPFRMYDGEIIGEPLCVNLELSEQISAGFNVSERTIDWWCQNDPEIFKSMFKNRIAIKPVMQSIERFIIDNNIKSVYATAALDYQGISNLSDLVGVNNPIPYRKRLCARTVYDLHESLFGSPIRPENNHDPLQDCKKQIDLLAMCINNISKNI